MTTGSYRPFSLWTAGLLLVACAGCSDKPPPSTPAAAPVVAPARPIEFTVDEVPQSVTTAECSRADEKIDILYSIADSDGRYFRRASLSKETFARVEAAGKIRVRCEKSGEGVEVPCKVVDRLPREPLSLGAGLNALREITFVGAARKEGIVVIGGVDDKGQKQRVQVQVGTAKVARIEAAGSLLILYEEPGKVDVAGRVREERRCIVEPDYEKLLLLLSAQ